MVKERKTERKKEGCSPMVQPVPRTPRFFPLSSALLSVACRLSRRHWPPLDYGPPTGADLRGAFPDFPAFPEARAVAFGVARLCLCAVVVLTVDSSLVCGWVLVELSPRRMARMARMARSLSGVARAVFVFFCMVSDWLIR